MTAPRRPYCSRCGLAGTAPEVHRVFAVDGYPDYVNHFGCNGYDGLTGDPIPLRDPADPPARPWVDAALAYGGDAA